MHRWEAFLQRNVENPHLDHAPPHILSMVNFSNLYAQQAFCSGKSIRLIVGPAFGGFYDRWARIFARDTSKSRRQTRDRGPENFSITRARLESPAASYIIFSGAVDSLVGLRNRITRP